MSTPAPLQRSDPQNPQIARDSLRIADVGEAGTGAQRPAHEDEFLQAIRRLSEGTRARRNIRIVAFLCDIFALCAAVMIGSAMRFGNPLAVHGLNIIGFTLPIYLMVAINLRCYQLGALRSLGLGLYRALTSFVIALGIVGLAAFFLAVSEDFSRAVLAIGSLTFVALLVASRCFLATASRRSEGRQVKTTVVIQDGVHADIPSDAILIDTGVHDLQLELDNPYLMDRLGHYLRFAERVVVACPPERRKLWSIALKGADIEGEVTAPELDAVGAVGIGSLGLNSTMLVSKSPLGAYDRALKRGLDLALTFFALLIIWPILLLVALAVKLDSPGPVLFRQARLGLGNRMFQMYKFRSMYVEGSDQLGATSTGRDDSRITRVGKFIRASSIDELPQIFNVLRGEMSIVGPRPHPILCKAENRLFWEIDLAYWHRHAIKPGITGLAQVRGLRGATENTAQFVDRLQADLEYLQSWSLVRDLGIIAATFRVLVHRNAY